MDKRINSNTSNISNGLFRNNNKSMAEFEKREPKIEEISNTFGKPRNTDFFNQREHLEFQSKRHEFSEANLQKAKLQKQQEERLKTAVYSLKKLESNTASLAEIVVILQRNEEKQDEIWAILMEIVGILNSSTEEEKKSKFKVVMEKINGFKDNTETFLTLYKWAELARKTFDF